MVCYPETYLPTNQIIWCHNQEDQYICTYRYLVEESESSDPFEYTVTVVLEGNRENG
jgi:hypothetical protein